MAYGKGNDGYIFMNRLGGRLKVVTWIDGRVCILTCIFALCIIDS